MTISNWNGSNRCTPAAIVMRPRDPDELIAIVRDTAAYPSPVRAVVRAALAQRVDRDGRTASSDAFRKIGEPDPVTNTVTVGAGVRMIDLKTR